MSGIQFILIAASVGLFCYYFFRVRNALMDLLIVLLFTSAAIFFIIFPNYTSKIAQKIGVGRGADLLFYLCILFFLFAVIKLFARIKRLEKQLTELVRAEAKNSATKLNG